MSLLDGIEKLITEHGSAAILKERIELANDKYAALEAELHESTARANALVEENKSLRENLEKANAELTELRNVMGDKQGSRLDEVKEKILVMISSRELYTRNIAQKLGIGEQVAMFHLEELEEAGFIGRSLSMMGTEFPWYLRQDARRYLVSNGLLV